MVIAEPNDGAEPRELPLRVLALSVAGIALGTAGILTLLGRIGWCRCGSPAPWSGDIWSSHNSQHLLDPYSFSHFQHGLVFYALLWLLARRRLAVGARGVLALLLEAGWEVLENTPLVIDRYRTGTISLDYTGDAILNSMGDLLSCGSGYVLAAVAPPLASAFVFLAIEATMLAVLRDSLLLNVWMLLAPSEAVRRWQAGG